MKIYLLLVVILFVNVSLAFGQVPNTAELKKTEMKKLEKWAGQWKGGGWAEYGPKKETFTGGENIQIKVDGLALLVEGKFTNAEGKVIHETLAVLSYDDKQKSYRFDTFLANGMSGEYDLKVFPDRFEWGFDIPAGTIRYTIKIDNTTWFEIGEFSRDGGKTWFKNFEMKLDRVK